MICYDSDTFAIGTLSPGSYTIHFTVDAGMAPFPCTPGIAPGAMDSISFTVSGGNYIPNIPGDSTILSAYFSNEQIHFKGLHFNMLPIHMDVFNLYGQKITESMIKQPDESVVFKMIPRGVYLLRYSGQGGFNGSLPLVVP